MEGVKTCGGGGGGGDVLVEQEVAVQVVEAGAAVASATRRSLKLLVELRLKPSAPSKVLESYSLTLCSSIHDKSRGIINGIYLNCEI